MPRPTSSETLPLPLWRSLRRLLGGTAWGWLYSRRELVRQPLLFAQLQRDGVASVRGASRRHDARLVPTAPQAEVEGIERVWRRLAVDKSGHGYADVYGGILTELRRLTRPIRILEIGILEGRSLMAWRELLPDATILGLDIDETVLFEAPGIRTEVADQMDARALAVAAAGDAPFDLIIDDGWHQPQANATALGVLWRLLAPEGYYVVEDIDPRRYRRFWSRVLARLAPGLRAEYFRVGERGLTQHDVLVVSVAGPVARG